MCTFTNVFTFNRPKSFCLKRYDNHVSEEASLDKEDSVPKDDLNNQVKSHDAKIKWNETFYTEN